MVKCLDVISERLSHKNDQDFVHSRYVKIELFEERVLSLIVNFETENVDVKLSLIKH